MAKIDIAVAVDEDKIAFLEAGGVNVQQAIDQFMSNMVLQVVKVRQDRRYQAIAELAKSNPEAASALEVQIDALVETAKPEVVAPEPVRLRRIEKPT